MQKVITHPKIKIPLRRNSQEVLKVWRNAQGIWKNKKINPVEYLREIREEWEKRNP